MVLERYATFMRFVTVPWLVEGLLTNGVVVCGRYSATVVYDFEGLETVVFEAYLWCSGKHRYTK